MRNKERRQGRRRQRKDSDEQIDDREGVDREDSEEQIEETGYAQTERRQ